MDLQGELGCAHRDPFIEGGIIMRESWIQNDVRPKRSHPPSSFLIFTQQKGIHDRRCCPTLMLDGGGPWLGAYSLTNGSDIPQRKKGLKSTILESPP